MLFFIALAVVSASLVLALKGLPALQRAATSSGWLLVSIAATIAVGMLLGGLVREIVDPTRVSAALGASSGWRGLVLASALGAVMPGGPFVAFPIVYALFLAGADVGAVIAFLTSWSLIALQRVIVWELPLLGPEFVIVRVLVSLPLPILTGLLARRLSFGVLAIAVPGGVTPRHDEPLAQADAVVDGGKPQP